MANIRFTAWHVSSQHEHALIWREAAERAAAGFISNRLTRLQMDAVEAASAGRFSSARYIANRSPAPVQIQAVLDPSDVYVGAMTVEVDAICLKGMFQEMYNERAVRCHNWRFLPIWQSWTAMASIVQEIVQWFKMLSQHCVLRPFSAPHSRPQITLQQKFGTIFSSCYRNEHLVFCLEEPRTLKFLQHYSPGEFGVYSRAVHEGQLLFARSLGV